MKKRKTFLKVFIAKFLISIPIVLIIFSVTFSFLDYKSEKNVKSQAEIQSDPRLNKIKLVLKDGTLSEEKDMIRLQLCLYQASTSGLTPGSSSIAYIEDSEGNIVLDSGSRMHFLFVEKTDGYDDNRLYEVYSCDLDYIKSHPELEPLIQYYKDYQNSTVLEYLTPRTLTDYYPIVLDGYADPETHNFYIGKLKLIKSKFKVFMGYETSDSDNYEKKDGITEYYDLTPEDTNGYLYYSGDENGLNKVFDGKEVSGFTILIGGYESVEEVYEKTSMWDNTEHISKEITDVNGDTYTVHFILNDKFFKAYRSLLVIILLVYFVIDIILCLILAKISYEKLKGFYRNEDYRKALMNSMAHDLKTPLTVMSGYAQNLKENIQSEKREHYAEAILENTDYMNSIIVDILSLSKLEESSVSASNEKVDFCEVANELKEKFAPLFDEKKITFSVTGSFKRKVNKATVTRVLDNLLTNAYKYTKENGTIKIIAKDTPFSPHTFVIENSPAESVKIKPEKLWDPFVKGDESRSENNGTGLGLSIVKNILDNHGIKSKIKIKNDTFKVIIR